MKKLAIGDVGYIIFSEKSYEDLEHKKIVDEEGNFLFEARVINLEHNLILIAPEENFKEE